MSDSKQLMIGRTCMITGATSGIGEVTARGLAGIGASVVMVGRSPERGAATVDQIKQQTGNPAVEFMLADLSSQDEIRKLAQRFKTDHAHLHVLVNNAGAWISRRTESVDGIEMTLALNHLGYFLLTNLLLDALKASAPARIINVSSYGHARGEIDFDDPQGRGKYNGMKAYRQSKLANLLFTYELARRLEGTGVTVNAVNPGLVATRFGFNNLPRVNGRAIKTLMGLYQLFGTSPEKGAETSIYLASSSEVAGVTGGYFEKKGPTRSSLASHDEASALRLWRLSAEMTGVAAIT